MPRPAYDRPSRVSVDPPFGRLDSPLHGRDDLINEIVRAAEFADDRPSVHILCGMGGSGKSHVALEIARRARADGRTVWWVQAGRLNSGMREVVSQLGASETQVDQAWAGMISATDLVWRYLNQAAQPWLLIFDSADEPASLGPTDGVLADGTGWLRRPEADDGMVIVTSRDGNRATWGTWSTLHQVRPLDADAGAQVLIDRAGTQAGDLADARELSRELGGLPLALRAAGNYLRSVNASPVWRGSSTITTFADYLAAVQRRFRAPRDASDADVDLDESLGLEIVREVDDISLDLLARRQLRQSRPLLNVLACLSTSPVPYEVVLKPAILAGSPLFKGLTASQRVRVLEGIGDLALVEFDVQEDVSDPAFAHVLSLHPLVHAMFRDREEVREQIAEYHGVVMKLLLAATEGQNPDYPADWANWDVLVPHLVEAVREYLAPQKHKHDPDTVRRALELARLTARYLIAVGLPGSAYDILEPIVRGCGAYDHDLDRPQVLALRHELGRTWLERNQPEMADRVLRQVIADRTRVLGSDDADTLASRHKLTKAIMAQRQWPEAEAELRQIVAAEDQVRGPEHWDTMIIRHSLALAVLAQQRAAEAEEMLHAILEVRYRLWPLNQPETWQARHTLARCMQAQGRLAEAEAELRATLATVEPRHADRSEVLAIRFTLAAVLLLDGQVDAAIEEYERLLTDRRRLLGDTHLDTLQVEHALRRLRDGG
ncbi:tetratricopeptide repeat protein [Micromonospora sp. WMMD1120]|uniref:tetratricopeptide repeat protein n=1 Tax=Micromonospora sp. WMMD1120 TaxID=3016106 RepID=UPI002415AC68|nr:tetratricopeptide repeat protein [Micromonospora sp. WMMD1120]MDG4806362.1 tetratricopeptide repeat protein [Micromonospora sp. WMMD1120]